ncbi:MAG TPA: PAS domain S-box protein [Thermoanaerobaculia bacterium]|nr:PAS domain S-box protein [Thermoanaerobaculia bacterium]
MSEPRALGPPPAPPHSDDTPYRVAFEKGLEAIVIVQDGRVCAVNPAATRLSGYRQDELLGSGFLEIVHPEDRAITAERYARRLAGDDRERSLTIRMLHKDGHVIWLESHSMPVEWQGRPAVLVFFADVSDRERSRRAAERQERMFQRVAELSPQFIFIYDYDQGRDVYINRSVSAALGYTPEQEAELEPYPFAKLCHPDDLAAAMEREHRWHDVPDGAVDAVEFRLLAANGEWRVLRSLNTPFQRDESGRVTQILGVSEDVTELRRSEEAMRRSEKLASLAVLAGGLAHDFGNLLTPILGHAELLLTRLPGDSRLAHHAESIRAAAEHAAELIEQLRVYAGRRPIELGPVDLAPLLGEAVDLYRPCLRAGVTLELEVEPGLPPVAGDPSQLRQVVLNLLTNALEALGARGGRVRLRARPSTVERSDLVRIDVHDELEPGPVVLLEVADDGAGMDAETRSRLWEPFFSTKPQGRGLGLASSLGILRRHGAGLGVESRPGEGTVFRVLLPVAPDAAVRAVAGAGS